MRVKKRDTIAKGLGTNSADELNIVWVYHTLERAEIYAEDDDKQLIALNLTGTYYLNDRKLWIQVDKGIVVRVGEQQMMKKEVKLSARKPQGNGFYFKGEKQIKL